MAPDISKVNPVETAGVIGIFDPPDQEILSRVVALNHERAAANSNETWQPVPKRTLAHPKRTCST